MKFLVLTIIVGCIILVGFFIGSSQRAEAPATSSTTTVPEKVTGESTNTAKPQFNTNISMRKITNISYYDEVSAPDPSRPEEIPIDTRVVSISFIREGDIESTVKEFYISAPMDLDGVIYDGIDKMSKGVSGIVKVKGSEIVAVDFSSSAEGRFLLEVIQ